MTTRSLPPCRRAALLPGVALALATATPASHGQAPETASPVSVQSSAVVPPPLPGQRSTAAFGLSRHELTRGYGDWSGAHLRVTWHPSGADTLYGTLESARRFGDSGTLASLQWVRDVTPDWQLLAVVAGTSGGTFWPASQYRLGLGRKWLEARNLVTTAVVCYNVSRNGYRDRLAEGSFAYYTPFRLVLQGGLRWNRSEPGDVSTRRVFGAITYGEAGRYYLTLRGSAGREGYQQLGGTAIVDFHSREVDLIWRQWVSTDWAVEARASAYRNPFYQRRGLDVSLVRSF